MGEINYVRLSKTISHALRHAPQQYGLELDKSGWIPVESLLAGLRAHRRAWRALTLEDLEAMMARPGKQRFEVQAGHIRALYGHSVDTQIARVAVLPPPQLYHGTAPRTAAIISREGLKPMNRQFVHLSADMETAYDVGRRKASRPIILVIDAAGAHSAGIDFYRGGEMIWLAEHIPPAYISQNEGANS